VHEYSIVQAMFDQIEAAAREKHAVAVRRVAVRIGAAAGVEVPLLRTAYELYRERTICADAPLDVEQVPVRWICPAGHGEVQTGGPLVCRECGRPARLESGDEIVLERLELEVP
jgi:hydrogenase nickel incorporation protein HypA/HybF